MREIINNKKYKEMKEKIKENFPRIVPQKYITGLIEEIKQAEGQADRYYDEKRQAIKDKESLERIKNSEISKLENTIKELRKDLSSKKSSLEEVIIQKESLLKKNKEFSDVNQQLGREKGNLIRSKNALQESNDKLNQENKAYKSNIKILNLHISDLERKLAEENDKSQLLENQRIEIQNLKNQIKELDPPVIEEYQQDGLPKQTKTVLKRKKFRK